MAENCITFSQVNKFLVSSHPSCEPILGYSFCLNPHLLRPLNIFLPELVRFDPFLFDRLKVREDEKEALGIVQRVITQTQFD